MEAKQLIVAVEATAAVAPFWQTIVSDYLHAIIRCFCSRDPTVQKPSTAHVELSLVVFNAHGSHSAFVVQRSGWTHDMDVFFQWLSAIPFAGGGFKDAAIADGLAEALLMFSSQSGNQNQYVEGQRHCILVAASNPHTLPTQPDNPLFGAEALAKSFALSAISLSVISPKQLPKLRGIYNAGRRNPVAADPSVDIVRNPHFLVLISENFMEARYSLSQSTFKNITSFPSNQNYVNADVVAVSPIFGQPLASSSSVNGSIFVRQPVSDGITPPATVKLEPIPEISLGSPTFPHVSPAASQSVPRLQTSSLILASPDMIQSDENVPEIRLPVNNVTRQTARSKYAEVWQGNLSGLRRGQPVFITRLRGYRHISASKTIAANWPPTLQIARLISEDHMRSSRLSVGKDGFLVFWAMDQHGFLGQMQERKLCAVIPLPSQTLLLSVSSDKAHRLIGKLFPGQKYQISSSSRIDNSYSLHQQREMMGTGMNQAYMSEGQVSSEESSVTHEE